MDVLNRAGRPSAVLKRAPIISFDIERKVGSGLTKINEKPA
jgi:hypothetical protein